MTVTFAASPIGSPVEPPRVGFALSRKVGTAVVRNRIRRQIQAHLRDVADTMASGIYLFSVKPAAAAVDRSTLLGDVDACLRRVAGRP